nr:DUF4383 domain-containing protein [Rhodococcus sp. KBS0724]
MDDSVVQQAAAGVGLVFLLVGIPGFIPGVTTDYGMLTFARSLRGETFT